MVKIKAKGTFGGSELEIVVVDGVTFINGRKDDLMDVMIHDQHPIGGTYFAEPDSMTNILNTLAFHFFDDPPKIETEGEFEEIPYEEGVIY